MKTEDIVCDSKYAKRLKRLGVKQDSLFYWIQYRQYLNGKRPYFLVRGDKSLLELKHDKTVFGLRRHYSAFTTDELLELLPQMIYVEKGRRGKAIHIDKERVSYGAITRHFEQIGKRPNALAQMLIRLTEEKLI